MTDTPRVRALRRRLRAAQWVLAFRVGTLICMAFAFVALWQDGTYGRPTFLLVFAVLFLLLANDEERDTKKRIPDD